MPARHAYEQFHRRETMKEGTGLLRKKKGTCTYDVESEEGGVRRVSITYTEHHMHTDNEGGPW